MSMQRCPECGSTATPNWTERSPDGYSECGECMATSHNRKWVGSVTENARDARDYIVVWQYDRPGSAMMVEEQADAMKAIERQAFLRMNAMEKGLPFALAPAVYSRVG